MHGPVLWTNPVTINDPICVPHYYWGVGRPEWVSNPRSWFVYPFCTTLPIALKMHGPVLWTNPVTINDPICVPHYYWGAGRPEWVSNPRSWFVYPFCTTLPIVLKMHGPVLWTNPVTINDPICVPHYYWGAGRPEWVSGSIPTVVLCPLSGLQFRLHVGVRSTLIQSLNQCRSDLWLYDTFLHNRIYIFVLSCYSNTQNSSLETQEYNKFLSHLLHIYTREVHVPQ